MDFRVYRENKTRQKNKLDNSKLSKIKLDRNKLSTNKLDRNKLARQNKIKAEREVECTPQVNL